MLRVLLLLAGAALSQAAAAPGKLVVWTSADGEPSWQGASVLYDTKTVDATDAVSLVAQLLNNHALVLLSSLPSASDVFEHESVAKAMRATLRLRAFPHIYPSRSGSSILAALAAALPEQAQPIALRALLSAVLACKSPSSKCVFSVQLEGGAEETELLSLLMARGGVTFVAVQEAESGAVVPSTRAHYVSLLANDTDNATSNGATGNGTVVDEALLYKPEGAEYSIYYANTYLYITPDIFTGLLTGLFMVFTALIGLNCMGAIQGPATFATKSPPNGKEG